MGAYILANFQRISKVQYVADASKYSIALTRFLLDNYPKYPVRPVLNETTPIVVYHRLTPIQIIDLDEANQILILKSWLGQTWVDQYLRWEPDKFGGIVEIQMKLTNLWQPDIVLFSSVSTNFERHLNMEAIVNYNGTVKGLQYFIAECTCAIDATFFPFDEQKCRMKFASWSYHGGYIDVQPDPNSNIDSFVNNGEWEMLEMQYARSVGYYVCCPGNPFPDVVYTLHLKRRSTFYFMNIILPSFLASILISVGFFLPSESGERVTLCVTSVLSQFVFMTVVSNHMPPTSDKIPHLQRFFFTSIGLGVFSTFMTAVTLSIHFSEPDCREVPPWLRKLTLKFLARLLFTRIRIPMKKIKKTNAKTTYVNKQDGILFTSVNIKNNGSIKRDKKSDTDKVKRTTVVRRVNDATPEEQERRMREWKEVSRVLDRVYLILYTVSLVAITFLYVAVIAKLAKKNHQVAHSSEGHWHNDGLASVR
ncbi:neuronal acetylcholine receptor subunit alpha-10-like [Glandiceps talaboti]